MNKLKLLLMVGLIIASPLCLLAQQTQFVADTNGYRVNFVLPSFTVVDSVINGNTYSAIVFENDDNVLYEMQYDGQPLLPKIEYQIAIPDNATDFKLTTRIDNKTGIVLPNSIVPYYSISGNDPIPTVLPYDFSHSIDTFELGESYYFMGERGLTLSFSPFVYDSINNQITAITNATIDFSYTGEPMPQYIARRNDDEYSDMTTLKLVFINWKDYMPNEHFQEIKGDYLIISPYKFRKQATAFENYKKGLGFNTQLALINDAGTMANQVYDIIKTWYSQQRRQRKFVLLVGDTKIIPPSGGNLIVDNDVSNPITDNYYAMIVGNDLLPDVHLGRFHVSDTFQLNNIINKTMYMETEYLRKHEHRFLLMSGSGEFQESFANNIRHCINKYLIPNNIPYTVRYGNKGATKQDFINDLIGGVTNVLYRGHGNYYSLGEPYSLSAGNIQNIQNGIKPTMLGFACELNNYFNNYYPIGACFVNSQYGTTTFWGSTTTSDLQCSNNVTNKIFQNIEKNLPFRTLIDIGGCKYIGSAIGQNKKQYAKSYILFGDPSFYIYGTKPNSSSAPAVNNNSTIKISEAGTDQTISYNIYTIDGKFIAKCDNIENYTVLNHGVYIIKCYLGNNLLYTTKILK